jgi:uncharacterized protein
MVSHVMNELDATADHMEAVSAETHRRIVERLAAVELEENARILFAVESGSRAWGFPSADSDYDVRFVYARPQEWYLSINVESRRDVIERPLTDLIDLSGWDLRKALALFARSNPPLLEWLDSPVVYLDRDGLASQLRSLLPHFFSPVGVMHHYLQMARGNFKAYLRGDRVRLKKYFYVLRPLLAARWVEQVRGPVPMQFSTLLETVQEHPALCNAITALVAKKRSGIEMNDGERIPVLHEFIEPEMMRLAEVAGHQPAVRGDLEVLNGLFREHLRPRE